MSDNEMAIVILSIIFGSVLGIIVIVKMFDVIKSWINSKNMAYDEEKFDRLAKAFIKHKKDSERRLQNLEAIVTGDDPQSEAEASLPRKLKETQLHNSIEIDEEEQKTEKRKKESGGGNLRNMLKE